MGLYDRDYYRNTLPRAGFGHFSAFSVTTWLIILNVAVFFLDGILHRVTAPPPPDVDPDAVDALFGFTRNYQEWVTHYLFDRMGPLEKWGYFSTDTAVYHGQVWRFLTFQFLHASGQHLLGNMIGLFFFGPIVEAHFGARRYLAFYLLCGLAGAACYLLLSFAHVLVTSPVTPMVGASAGIFGLLVAAAIIAPHVEVFYYYMPVTIGMLAVIGMLMAAYAVFATGPNAGGEAGHLGGGVLGFLLMRNQHWLHPFAPRLRLTTNTTATSTRRRPRRAFQKDWSKDFNR